MSTTEQPYLSIITKDGRQYWHDRRVSELQADGTSVIRDPVTRIAYDPITGKPKPADWTFSDDWDDE